MRLSFSLLAAATALTALVSAHPAQQLKRATNTPATTPTTTTAPADAGIPNHASTITDAIPPAVTTTPPSSCGGGNDPPGAAIKGRVLACPAW